MRELLFTDLVYLRVVASVRFKYKGPAAQLRLIHECTLESERTNERTNASAEIMSMLERIKPRPLITGRG